MSSYIYTTGGGADPGAGHPLNDPIFGPVPTLGACMPNLRSNMNRGDWIFIVSSRRTGVAQYVLGGIRVAERISALAAYERFPDYRLSKNEEGRLIGNVVVTADGEKHPLDAHNTSGFERRVQNYIVGDKSIEIAGEQEVSRARDQTLPALTKILGRPGNRVFDIIGRQRKLVDEQTESMISWLENLKLPPR